MAGPMQVRFLCSDRMESPVVGVPVYVSDEARKKNRFPKKHRGGTIVEDCSFMDAYGNVYYLFKVQHANGLHVWSKDELVEIGGVNVPVDWALPPELNN